MPIAVTLALGAGLLWPGAMGLFIVPLRILYADTDIFPPASIYGWDEVIAVHKWMINEPDDSLDDAVILEHTLACFPAAPIEGDPTTEAAHPVLVQANWDNRIIERAGPGALTFATTVRSRDTLVEWISTSNTTQDISVDWRIDRIRVRGRITADSVPGGVELIRSDSAANRASGMSSVQTDYWLIPGEAVHRLAGDPTARLTLDYDLALLSPTPYELKTDGVSREFPLLGTCRAEIDDNANAIEIECMKQGARPALVSAKLVGVTGSRVDSYSRPSYAPDWLESIGRGRYELTLRSPNLVDSSAIIVTAYEVERILHKQLESPGILGGPPSICPTPGSEQYAAVEGSSWSDKSPHEVSFVSVDRGVRVEVLDWRTDAHTDKPVLFLIPGLGATAHSYDDVAPKLAEKYAVVGMTRRGTGASSKPDYGYDVARLSQDVIRVLDTLGIESAILVGVSIAGSELSFLGANYPQRFAGLLPRCGLRPIDHDRDRAAGIAASEAAAAAVRSRLLRRDQAVHAKDGRARADDARGRDHGHVRLRQLGRQARLGVPRRDRDGARDTGL